MKLAFFRANNRTQSGVMCEVIPLFRTLSYNGIRRTVGANERPIILLAMFGIKPLQRV